MGKIADRIMNRTRKRTGNCFSTCIKEMDNLMGWELVHGIPLGRSGHAEGIRYPHAWLESPDGGIVFDPNLHENGINPYVPAEAYYTLGDIQWTVRYPPDAARKRLLESGNYGPWHDKLIELDRKIG